MVSMKLGRNDPCHCGSGEKYKRCHGKLGIQPAFQPVRQQAHSAVHGTPSQQEINTLMVLFNEGRLAEIITLAQRMTESFPMSGVGWKVLGVAFNQMGRGADALVPMKKAIALSPGDVEVHYNLGVIFQGLGRFNEAEASYRQALQINPNYGDAYNNLGASLQHMGRLEEAVSCYWRLLKIKPNGAEPHYHLGLILQDIGRLTEAEACYRRAIEIKPNYAEAHQNLALILAHLSDFEEVVAESDTAMRLKPDSPVIWGQRLYAFSYHPDLAAEQIYGEFTRWGDRFPEAVVDFSAHDRTPGRRLRIGYVSPDFYRHSCRFFLWPLLANHNSAVVELYAYSNVKMEDEFTKEFKELFDHWRNIWGGSDSEVARMIREDGIDILVDCSNHTRDNRLDVFALKPAPIQTTWLGTAWTTGLKMIDYVLMDPYMAPEGTLMRETILWLPHCFVAYRPPEETAEIAPPPCLRNGYVTFGYTGRSEKLNHRTFRVWGEILRRNPTSRLILDYRGFDDPLTQAYYREFMARHGMNPDQVIMRKSANIFVGLNDIDILFDCFPHNGGTTLFDALWMGVPALTLASRPPVGRIGASLMINLGLPEWVAASEEEYIAKASIFAENPKVLEELRAGMRERMKSSPLMDGPGFARGVEAAYREMFEKWVFCV